MKKRIVRRHVGTSNRKERLDSLFSLSCTFAGRDEFAFPVAVRATDAEDAIAKVRAAYKVKSIFSVSHLGYFSALIP